jgi:hypothetical protein
LMVSSALADATILPSGLKATDNTISTFAELPGQKAI